jgi:hypothetical protein
MITTPQADKVKPRRNIPWLTLLHSQAEDVWAVSSEMILLFGADADDARIEVVCFGTKQEAEAYIAQFTADDDDEDTQPTKTNGSVRYHIRRFTAEDVETIRRDWDAYVPLRVMAQKLDRTWGTLRQKIRHLGLRRSNQVLKCLQWAPEHLKSRRALLSDEDFIAACKHWREQEQQKTAAKKVEDRLQIVEIARTISQRTDLDRRTKMKLMRKAGATLKEVGQCFGITRERVRQITTTASSPRAAPLS